MNINNSWKSLLPLTTLVEYYIFTCAVLIEERINSRVYLDV